ncbi:MAG TPA: carbon storage regulator CsrA [Verrucomicrobiae bacterium]|nr:carbon storage regulator CsrA [Verrucomicrobiae bacterium]
MLVLTRKVGDSVVIDGRIRVVVLRAERDSIRLGIDAPSEIAVHRQEVYEEVQRTNQQAVTTHQTTVPKLPSRKSARQQARSEPSVPEQQVNT